VTEENQGEQSQPQDQQQQQPEAQGEPPAQQGEHQPEQPEAQRQARMVPYDSLHEERQRRREVQEELRREREQMARERDIVNQRLAVLHQPQAQQRPAPSRDEDPVSYFEHQIGALREGVQQALEPVQAIQAQQAQANQIQQIASAAGMQVEEFRGATPDYDQAYQHVRSQTIARYRAMGMSAQEIVAQINQDEVVFAARALKSGQNVGEAVYNYAKATGYQPQGAQKGASEQLAAEAKAAAAARNLGSGVAAKGALSYEALASMSDEEFAKLAPDVKMRAMGG